MRMFHEIVLSTVVGQYQQKEEHTNSYGRRHGKPRVDKAGWSRNGREKQSEPRWRGSEWRSSCQAKQFGYKSAVRSSL